MSQSKTIRWVNPAGAVARNESVGFEVASITTTDITVGGQWHWNDQMAVGTDIHVDTGGIDAANGFTPLAQDGVFGAAVSGFTNANPGVITADYIAQCGIVAGDVVNVVGLADDMSAVSLNGQYTVDTVTATTITLVDSTAALAVYVSGGTVVRVKDSTGAPVPTQNFSIRGITIGTAAVGAGNSIMTALILGKNCVL